MNCPICCSDRLEEIELWKTPNVGKKRVRLLACQTCGVVICVPDDTQRTVEPDQSP